VSLHDLDAQFALLDQLSDALYIPVVTHTHGELVQRITGILQWRNALLMGQLPNEKSLVWPEKSICHTVLMRLEVLDMVQYCQEQEALTDSIIESILDGVSSAEDQANKYGDTQLFNDEIAQRQKMRDRDSVFEDTEDLSNHQQNNTPTNSSQNNTQSEYTSARAQSDPLNQESENTLADTQSEPFNQENKRSDNLPTPNDIESQYSTTPSTTVIQQDSANTVTEDFDSTNTTNPKHLKTQQTEVIANNNSEISPTAIETMSLNKDASPQHYAIAQSTAKYLEQQWQALAATWHELSEHYDGLSKQLGLGWDLSQGILETHGWRNIIQHRKRIKQSAYLQQLIAALGRLQQYNVAEEQTSLRDTVINPIKWQVESQEKIITSNTINDTGGIQRGDDIARMLPSELGLLGNKKLKMLWHVKRAERTLLSYQLRGTLSEKQTIDQAVLAEINPQNNQPQEGYGPIIICLDTSASMQGEPEQIAKALVLEALRIATDEQRACYVYSFGGQQQIIEHQLDLSKGGLSKLLNFLQQSFSGGTDVSFVLKKALAKQQQAAWQTADILLISDGRFPKDSRLLQTINQIKQQSNLRIHGVLLGHWKGEAIQDICEPLHHFVDIDCFNIT
jgi:uncharacterized protein with von Willebrand factor type A (vWA) domain